MTSYFTNRFQAVKIGTTYSKKFRVLSGVPQGSQLGFILFLIFINDLPTVINHSACLLFADDLKVFRSISYYNDCLLLQSDLTAVSVSCTNNFLILNIKKCQAMSLSSSTSFLYPYNIGFIELSRVNCMKDLGVILDPKLTFNFHLD